MLLGYIMPIYEAHATLSDSEFEDSSLIEKFAADNKLDMEIIDHDCIVFIVANVDNAISLREVARLRKKYAEKIKGIKKILEDNKFELASLSLVSDPVWSRHGEPLVNY